LKLKWSGGITFILPFDQASLLVIPENKAINGLAPLGVGAWICANFQE
jgi:hypothetical protein